MNHETLEGLGEFLTVMQTLDFVLGLHNYLKFFQCLSCLYQALQAQKTFSAALMLTGDVLHWTSTSSITSTTTTITTVIGLIFKHKKLLYKH